MTAKFKVIARPPTPTHVHLTSFYYSTDTNGTKQKNFYCQDACEGNVLAWVHFAEATDPFENSPVPPYFGAIFLNREHAIEVTDSPREMIEELRYHNDYTYPDAGLCTIQNKQAKKSHNT